MAFAAGTRNGQTRSYICKLPRHAQIRYNSSDRKVRVFDNSSMEFLVGTFNTPRIHSFHFTPNPPNLRITHTSPAIGSHAWLSVSPTKAFLYATAWTTPPSVAAYRINRSPIGVELIGSKPIRCTSGYVTVSSTHLYSAGGSTGEVFTLNDDGSIGDLVQELTFLDKGPASGFTSGDQHGDFGGLRHGAHSIDLSPDGQYLYVADIGRNCVWTYSVSPTANASNKNPSLSFAAKVVSPRANDGPRHTTPHPNGRMLYTVQEHSSMLDAFTTAPAGTGLRHESGGSIIPPGRDPAAFWADEVRLSRWHDPPRYLYGSTRGLDEHTRGYVVVYAIDADGFLVGADGKQGGLVTRWETPTSGGIANAIEPAPRVMRDERGVEREYLALTDSQGGCVFVLSFDGQEMAEVARLKVTDGVDAGEVVRCATAVWL